MKIRFSGTFYSMGINIFTRSLQLTTYQENDLNKLMIIHNDFQQAILVTISKRSTETKIITSFTIQDQSLLCLRNFSNLQE